MEYENFAVIGWNESTRRGFTPREKLHQTLLQSPFQGKFGESELQIGESISITLATSEGSPSEHVLPEWMLDSCMVDWWIEMPVRVDVALGDASLDFGGEGTNYVSHSSEGSEERCSVQLGVDLDDGGSHRAWYDVADAHFVQTYGGTAERADRVSVLLNYDCIEETGRLVLLYSVQQVDTTSSVAADVEFSR